MSTSDLPALEGESDLVVQTTITAPAVAASDGIWSTALSDVTVLGRKNASTPPAAIAIVDPSDPSSYRGAGTYILFLSSDPGSPYYVVTNGLDGMYRIDGGALVKECPPDYGGSAPATATLAPPSGAITTVTQLTAAIPAVLPTYTPPAKPTQSMTPVGPAVS